MLGGCGDAKIIYIHIYIGLMLKRIQILAAVFLSEI